MLVMLECTGAGHGFNAANSSGDGLFTDDFQDADIADTMDVRATAKFLAVKAARGVGIGDSDHAHIVLGIFVAEKCEGSGGQSFFERSDVSFDGGIEANFFVDLLLYVAEFLRVDGSEMS